MLRADHFKLWVPKKIRTFKEFAESEIIVSKGPRDKMRYSCDFMPWIVGLFAVFDSNTYRRFFGSGPVQGGKTFHWTVITVLYHLFEVEEDVILCGPDMNLVQEVYEDKIKPLIKDSRFRRFLPKLGRGAKGGKVDKIKFGNGASLRFMGAGGNDGQRSSHTARVIVMTEVDKYDTSGASSDETSKSNQMEARSDSFGEDAIVYAECTLSTSEGQMYNEIFKWGTGSKMHFMCPYCSQYISFERDNFIGWGDCETINQARKNARYECNKCHAHINEDDRRMMLHNYILVHDGQTVEGTTTTGSARDTDTFGFSWNAMSSPLRTMRDIAADEFKAERAGTDDAQKRMHQFVWTMPFDDDISMMLKLDNDTVIKKINSFAKGELPPNTGAITVGIDVGKYKCWWSVWAWKQGGYGYCIDYGRIDVEQGSTHSDLAILDSLRQFKEDYLMHGWDYNGAKRKPDLVLVDSGYETDAVYAFVREVGSGCYAVKGLGTAKNEKSWSAPKPGPGRKVGHEWVLSRQPSGQVLLTMHSDYWKTQVQTGFLAPMGHSGCLSIYRAEKRDHQTFAKHIAAEYQEEEFIPGKGRRIVWNRKHKDNHQLDTTYYARVGADMLGIRVKEVEEVA